MFKFKEVKKKYGDNKRFEELKDKAEFEKGDGLAMFIAAIVVFIPPLLIISGIMYFILWVLFLR